MTRAALWALGLAAALWLFGRLWPVLWGLLWPFLAGSALALLLERPVQWLVAHGLSRTLASLVSLVGALGAAGGLCAWALGAAWAELWRLRGHLPAIYAALAAALQRLSDGASARAQGILPPPLGALLTREVARGYEAAGPLVSHLLGRMQAVASGLPDALFALFVMLATAFFLCRDRPRLAAWLDAHLPVPRAGRVRLLAAAARDSVWGMLRAQLLLALATFGISLVGLWVIGAPYVFLASLAAALFDLLPVVGPGLVYVPWIVGAAANHLPGAALALAAVFAAVAAARWLLTPQLLGSQVGLHPFVALAAMYVGARLAGVTGLLLGPLAAALVQAAWPPAGRPPGAAAPPGAAPPPAAVRRRAAMIQFGANSQRGRAWP